jgi:hypothetical protein
MVELAVLVIAVAGVGLVRPRWSSLLVAVVPAGLAFLWLLLHEDVPEGLPGADVSASDIAWYVVMSALVGVAFALPCALGVIAGSALRKRRARGAALRPTQSPRAPSS